MALTLFDLDDTLLAGDSDHLWGEWLCQQNLVDVAEFRARNDRFYEDYKAARLDIDAYLAFNMEILAKHDMAQLQQWHRQFMIDCIEPIIQPKAIELVEKHRQAGDTLMIITATNRFITEPIAKRFGVGNLIASEPEVRDGRYTGRSTGMPSFREGKVIRLEQWLKAHNQSLENSYFYSDSRNDVPLLEKVSHPVAVDPDDSLRQIASERRWSIISLRQGS